ncbi:MAG: polysaccharide deacetylase family protein [Pseudomonadota bacterium]|nr:polysaccharide deacetylase family protein [Pseudomonadota bacterium]
MSQHAQAVPVLMYHHVSPNPGLVTVSPGTFTDHMGYLARAGYTTLTADQFLGFLQGSYPAPSNSVLITFDDGYLDNYVYAYPTLRSLGLHAVIFCVTGWLSDGRPRNHVGASTALPTCPNHSACKQVIAAGRADEVMLRWSEVQQMSDDGTIEVHSHTHTHTRWDKLIPDAEQRTKELDQDLLHSQQTLLARLGKQSNHLCWPQGYLDAAYQTAATRLGFVAQYTTLQHVNTRTTAPNHIGRFVAKDLPANWLATRLFLYSRPIMGSLYHRLRSAL